MDFQMNLTDFMDLIHSATALSFLEYVGMFFVFIFLGKATVSFFRYMKTNIAILGSDLTKEEQKQRLSKPTGDFLKNMAQLVVFQFVIFGYYFLVVKGA